jgi:hypothetical protein
MLPPRFARQDHCISGDYEARRDRRTVGFGSISEDAFPGFMSGTCRGRKSWGAFGNTFGAGSGGSSVMSGTSSLLSCGLIEPRSHLPDFAGLLSSA